MKYLKKYSSFNEEDEFDVTAMDPTNVKKSKEDLNKVRVDIDEYNKLKANIDTIYKTAKTDAEIERKVSDLLGPDKEKRNPFLINYLTVASDERKVRMMVDGRSANKLKVDEYNDLISMSDNPTQKTAMQAEVANLNKKMSIDAASLAKLKTDINKRKKDIESNISKILKDMQGDIKNISKSIK